MVRPSSFWVIIIRGRTACAAPWASASRFCGWPKLMSSTCSLVSRSRWLISPRSLMASAGSSFRTGTKSRWSRESSRHCVEAVATAVRGPPSRSDFPEDLVRADEPQHDFPSALRGHADPYEAGDHREEPEPRVALSEYRGSDRIADQAGVRGELTHDLAGHATEELVPCQEGALVGHQVVEVHRTLNVKWASILPGRRFRLNGLRTASSFNRQQRSVRSSHLADEGLRSTQAWNPTRLMQDLTESGPPPS